MSGGNVQSYFVYFNQYGQSEYCGSESCAPVRYSGEEPPGFHWADYVVFVATLVIALGIGIVQGFTGDRQRTTSEYLMGNR